MIEEAELAECQLQAREEALAEYIPASAAEEESREEDEEMPSAPPLAKPHPDSPVLSMASPERGNSARSSPESDSDYAMSPPDRCDVPEEEESPLPSPVADALLQAVPMSPLSPISPTAAAAPGAMTSHLVFDCSALGSQAPKRLFVAGAAEETVPSGASLPRSEPPRQDPPLQQKGRGSKPAGLLFMSKSLRVDACEAGMRLPAKPQAPPEGEELAPREEFVPQSRAGALQRPGTAQKGVGRPGSARKRSEERSKRPIAQSPPEVYSCDHITPLLPADATEGSLLPSLGEGGGSALQAYLTQVPQRAPPERERPGTPAIGGIGALPYARRPSTPAQGGNPTPILSGRPCTPATSGMLGGGLGAPRPATPAVGGSAGLGLLPTRRPGSKAPVGRGDPGLYSTAEEAPWAGEMPGLSTPQRIRRQAEQERDHPGWGRTPPSKSPLSLGASPTELFEAADLSGGFGRAGKAPLPDLMGPTHSEQEKPSLLANARRRQSQDVDYL